MTTKTKKAGRGRPKYDRPVTGWKYDESNRAILPSQISALYKRYGSKYKNGIPVTLTKADAKVILNYGMPNRDLNGGRIKTYRERMNSGEWIRESAVSICFNDKRRLTDGQSRLTAFVESELETIEVDVAINVSDKMINYYTDERTQNRTPRDRAQRFLRNGPNSRSAAAGETSMLQYAHIYSPANKVFSKIETAMYEEIYTDPLRSACAAKTIELFDEIDAPKAIKGNPALRGCVYRAIPHFEEAGKIESLQRFLVLVFNTRAQEKYKYDGWAKLTKDILDKVASRPIHGYRQIKSLYVTLNEYLYNYYSKIPCPETAKARLNRKVTGREERFLFPYEIEQEAIQEAEKEAVQEATEEVVTA